MTNTRGHRDPTTGRFARRPVPDADTELAQSGQGRLRVDHPAMVHQDDAVHPIYGTQGAVLRTAARSAGPMDPSAFLIGLESHSTPASDVPEVTDGMPGVQDVPGVLRPASRGMGRARER